MRLGARACERALRLGALTWPRRRVCVCWIWFQSKARLNPELAEAEQRQKQKALLAACIHPPPPLPPPLPPLSPPPSACPHLQTLTRNQTVRKAPQHLQRAHMRARSLSPLCPPHIDPLPVSLLQYHLGLRVPGDSQVFRHQAGCQFDWLEPQVAGLTAA
jgi:hypothetical protein